MAWASSEHDGWVPKVSVLRESKAGKLFLHDPALDHFCLNHESKESQAPGHSQGKRTTNPTTSGEGQCPIATTCGMGYLWEHSFWENTNCHTFLS